MTMTVEVYYDGFRTFSWLADFIDLPIDQVRNFYLFTFLRNIQFSYLPLHRPQGGYIDRSVDYVGCLSVLLSILLTIELAVLNAGFLFVKVKVRHALN